MANVNGDDRDNTLRGTKDRGGDTFNGRGGDDTISGGSRADRVIYNITEDGQDRVNLGGGLDLVRVSANNPTNVRLTFTSSEVGNGSAVDGSQTAPQDGDLAVRMQAEDGGVPFGGISRYDDEGVIFFAAENVTFDVRDLVTGAQRGEAFEVVILGTHGNDTQTPGEFPNRVYYMNGGAGNDTLNGGNRGDFLVGGSGADRLFGNLGDDRFIGGAGNDLITGGDGDDTIVSFNLSTDGADTAILGAGNDTVNVTKNGGGQIRLTLTSAEVGNNSSYESGTLANQDGRLGVRMQAENGLTDALSGATSRFDDEGVTFVATNDVRFDIRDTVSGTARGAAFGVATLGTHRDDTINAISTRAHYLNGGAGNDVVNGGLGSDTLVGGAGDDVLAGGGAHDTLIGGAGNDTLVGGDGNDILIGGAGEDILAGQSGADVFRFESVADSPSVATADTISNFDSGVDKIDLSAPTGALFNLNITSFDTYDLVTLDSDLDGDVDLAIIVQGERVQTTDFIT